MKREEYLGIIEKKMTRRFDIEKNVSFVGEQFDLKCSYRERNSEYIINPDWELYASENNEYHFIKFSDHSHFSKEYLKTLMDKVVENHRSIVSYKKDHMASQINIALILEERPSDEEILSYVKKYKCQKSSFLGLKGWVDFGIILYFLQDNGIVSNKKGGEVKAAYLLKERDIRRQSKTNDKGGEQ